MTCGDSSEKSTIVHMEGVGELLFSGPSRLKTEQIVSLTLGSRGQIRDLLAPLSQPKLLDGLIFSFDDDPVGGSAAVRLDDFQLPVESIGHILHRT